MAITKTTSAAISAEFEGAYAPHVSGNKETLGKSRIPVSMLATVAGDVPEAVRVMMLGLDKARSERSRKKTGGWQSVSDGLVSPTVRNFQGPRMKLQAMFRQFPGLKVRVAIKLRTDDATVCQTSLAGIGTADGIWVSQSKDATWRVAGECSSYEDVQRLLVLGQALAVVTELKDGQPSRWHLAAACAGENDLCKMHNNYSIRRCNNPRPVSYTW